MNNSPKRQRGRGGRGGDGGEKVGGDEQRESLRRGRQSKRAEADSMGGKMTARNEGCLRGLYRGEREREREEVRVETDRIPEDVPPGREDRLLLFSFHSFTLSPVVSLRQIKLNSLLCHLTVFMTL